MRTTFLIDLDCQPVSANAPKDHPHAFKVSDMILVVAPYRNGYGDIPAGTKLFVSRVDDDDGTMWLLAEGDVPALFHWDNMIVASPYDCEDLLPCLRAVPHMRPEVIPAAPGILLHQFERKLGTKLALIGCMAALGWATTSHVTTPPHFHHVAANILIAKGTAQLDNG